MSEPARAAIATQYDVMRRGVQGMLADRPDLVTVVPMTPTRPTDNGPDVIIYDAVRIHDEDSDSHLRQIVESHHVPVIVIAPHFRADLINRSLAAGATAAVSFAVTAEQLVEVVEGVGRGRAGTEISHYSGAIGTPDHGFGVGLTGREAQVVGMVAHGRSNREIADQLFLSINSVKTYIRSSYRKIGVQSRSQAVLWAFERGLTGASSRS